MLFILLSFFSGFVLNSFAQLPPGTKLIVQENTMRQYGNFKTFVYQFQGYEIQKNGNWQEILKTKKIDGWWDYQGEVSVQNKFVWLEKSLVWLDSCIGNCIHVDTIEKFMMANHHLTPLKKLWE